MALKLRKQCKSSHLSVAGLSMCPVSLVPSCILFTVKAVLYHPPGANIHTIYIHMQRTLCHSTTHIAVMLLAEV